MKVLLVIGIVFAAIAAIIAFILLLPVRVIIKYSDGQDVKLLTRFLGKTFGENPNPNSIVVKSAKKITGISKLDSIGTVKKSIDDMGVSATAGQIVDIVMLLLGRFFWILKYCVAEKLHIKAVCAGDDAADAAMEYGAVCAVVYPLAGYIETVMQVKQGGYDVSVICDFESYDTTFELDTVFRVRVFYIIGALFNIIKQNVEKQVYSQSAVQKSEGE